MKYFVLRDGREYGPYELEVLRGYVASGHVLLQDLARGEEGSTATTPVGELLGWPQPAPPPAVLPPSPVARPAVPPLPPNLHWGLVLLFSIVTLGLFTSVWDLVQAGWMRRVQPASKALFFYIGAMVLLIPIFFASFVAGLHGGQSSLTPLLNLVYLVLILAGRFSLRSSLQSFLASVGLPESLSGVLTFFFGSIYFQYKINDFVPVLRAGPLPPL